MMARELEGRFSLLLDEQEKISQKSPYASLVRLNIGDIKSRNFHFTLASWVVALTVYINMMKAHLGKMQSFLSDLLKCQDRELLEDVVEQNIKVPAKMSAALNHTVFKAVNFFHAKLVAGYVAKDVATA